MNIGFVGLGKLGMPCAEVFAEKHNVFGFDIKEKESNIIEITKSIEELVENTEIIFVAVQTPHHTNYGGEKPTSDLQSMNFDYTYLENTIIEINKFCNHDKIIVIISTVLPGTIRAKFHNLCSNATLLYNPYLIAMGTVKDDFKNPEMIIIGSIDGVINAKINKLIYLYNNIIIENYRLEFGTWEEAESIKIFYNTFISMKIAIVNMIQDVAENIGNMNVDIVTNALSNSSKRIISKAYMKAGMGDGGPCHPRDNIALSFLANQLNLNYDLFHAIAESREQQAKNIAIKLAYLNNPVVILGVNYKPNVSLTDGSYALLIAHYLIELNNEVYFDNHPNINNIYTYLISHEGIYNEFSFTTNSIIFDIWRTFKTNRKDLKIISYGNTRIN